MAFRISTLAIYCTFLFSFSFAELSWASPVLKQEFGSTYYSHYREGRCGENTAELAKRAMSLGVDLTNAQALVITNGGYLLSTMYRRGSGAKLATPVAGIGFEPGIKNFYFHVALVKDGEVYDFDFGNEPEVLSMKDYIRRMFWEERSTTQFKMVDALKFRRAYKIALVPISDYLRNMNAEGVAQQTLGDFDDAL